MSKNLPAYLEKDYDDARNAIDKFDGQLFTIRNWAVTTVGALLALAFTTREIVVLFVALVATGFFCYQELTYKCFHEDAMTRSQKIEGLLQQYLNSGRLPTSTEYSFGLSSAFAAPTLRRMWAVFRRRRHIAAFYLGLMAALAIAAVIMAIDGAGATKSEPAEQPSTSVIAAPSPQLHGHPGALVCPQEVPRRVG